MIHHVLRLATIGLMFAGAVPLAFAEEPINNDGCDFTGPYSGSCVTRLASGRPGGVLVIAAPDTDTQCQVLSDTAEYTAELYCSGKFGNLYVSYDPIAGGRVLLATAGPTRTTRPRAQTPCVPSFWTG